MGSGWGFRKSGKNAPLLPRGSVRESMVTCLKRVQACHPPPNRLPQELLEDEDTKAAAVTAQAVEKEVVSKEKALKAAQDKAVSEAIKIALTCKTPAAEPSAAGPRGVFPRPPPRAPPGVAPMGVSHPENPWACHLPGKSDPDVNGNYI